GRCSTSGRWPTSSARLPPGRWTASCSRVKTCRLPVDVKEDNGVAVIVRGDGVVVVTPYVGEGVAALPVPSHTVAVGLLDLATHKVGTPATGRQDTATNIKACRVG